MEVMNVAFPLRCLLELGTDELQETSDVCREHAGTLIAGGGLIAEECLAAVNSRAGKKEAPAMIHTEASPMPTRVGGTSARH